MKNPIRFPWTATLTLAALIFAAPLSAQEDAAQPQNTREAQATAEAQSQEGAAQQVQQQEAAIVEEVAEALRLTERALDALYQGEEDEALDLLAQTTGKLELAVTRDPDLALAPVDVSVTVHDLVASVDDVEEMVDQAEELLEKGRVQDARALLKDLGSEMVISVVNLPLATYPDAIKAAVLLVDADMPEQAASVLEEALSTLVVVDHVVPLPLLRAERALAVAQEMAAREDRDEQVDQAIADLIQIARDQLDLAKALGYGDEDAFDPFYEALDEISEQTASGGKAEEGFSRLGEKLKELRDRIFE